MAVNEIVDIPVFRPLIGSDKQEIIERAKQIGTYEISCQTAPDCCTLFMPRRPETHAKLDAVHEAWNMFDHETMIDYLVEHVEYVDFTAPVYKRPRAMRERHDELAPRFLRPRPMRPKTLQRNDFHAAVGRLMRTGLRRYGRFDPVLLLEPSLPRSRALPPLVPCPSHREALAFCGQEPCLTCQSRA